MQLSRPLIAVATVTAIIMAPTIASASEVLDDGAYDIAVTEESVGFTILDGAPDLTAVPEGWSVSFTTDDAGKVLDTFTVSTPEGDYEVTVGDDGPVVTPVEAEPDVDAPKGEEPQPEADPESLGSEGDAIDGEEPEGDAPEGDALEADAPEGDEVEDDEARSVASTIAACMPQGRLARDAGWPNQGRLVSAAARGDVVSVGEVLYDLSDEAGLAALCEDAEVAVAALDDDVEGEPAEEETSGEDDGTQDADEPTDGDDAAQEADDESADSDEGDDEANAGRDKDGQRGNGNARGRPDHAGGPGGR